MPANFKQHVLICVVSINLTFKKVSLKLKMYSILTNFTQKKKRAAHVSISLQRHKHKPKKNHNFIDLVYQNTELLMEK